MTGQSTSAPSATSSSTREGQRLMLAALARDLELDTLTVEQDDRVLLVRFCDPPHNFMTTRMQKDLDILTAAVDADTAVGAVVLGPQRSHAAYRCKELIRGGAAPADPLAEPNSHQ